MKRLGRIASLALMACMLFGSAFDAENARADEGLKASGNAIEEDFKTEEAITFVDVDGKTYTTGTGKATAVLFGHTMCMNCQQVVSDIAKSDLIKSEDVQFVFADVMQEDIATLRDFRTTYGSNAIMFCSDDNSIIGSYYTKLWSLVSSASGSITTPVIIYFNKAGEVIDNTTGYQPCSEIQKIFGDEVTVPKENTLGHPMSLSVVVSDNIVTKLYWGSVDGASGYQIYRSKTSTDGFTMIAHSLKTEYEDSGLDTETVYYYKVRAYATVDNKVIYGDYSMTMGIMTGDKLDISPTPTRKATVTPTKKTTVTPTRKATVTPTKKATVTPTRKATVTPTKKATATPTRKATVTPTRKVTLTPTITKRPTSLAAPGNVSASPASPTTVNISWKAAAGTSFVEVWRTTKANAEQKDYVCIGIYNAADGASVSKLLTPNKTYYYKVRGYIKFSDGKKVYSGYSKVVSATPKIIIAVPSGLRVTATTNNSVSLSWNKVSGSNIMYEVFRMDVQGKTPGVCIGRYDTTSSVSKKLTSNKTYYYRVRAYFYFYGTDGQTHRVYSYYSSIVSGKTKT